MKASNSAPGLQMCRERLGCNLRQRRDLTHLNRFLPDGNGPNGNPIFLAPKKKQFFFAMLFFGFCQISIIFLVVVRKCYKWKMTMGRSEIRSLFRGHIGGNFRFQICCKRNNQWGMEQMDGQNQVEVFHGSSHCHWGMVNAFFNTKQWPIHRPRILNFNQRLYVLSCFFKYVIKKIDKSIHGSLVFFLGPKSQDECM